MMQRTLILIVALILTGCSANVAMQPLQFVSPLPTPGYIQSADFNGDGHVTLIDWSRWRLHYLAGDGEADLNRDGFLDSADLQVLRGQMPP